MTTPVTSRRSHRRSRLQSQLSTEIPDILRAKSHQFAGSAFVVGVRLNRDCSLATVTLRCQDKAVLSDYVAKAGEVRSELAARLRHMRRLPQIRFVADDGREEDALRQKARLASIEDELGPGVESEEASES